MSDIPNSAYRYALVFYIIFFAFIWYLFHASGLFIAQHYMPQSASGFSVANPNFAKWNYLSATVLSVVAFVFLFASRKLKDYVVDVGDELTRVSWVAVSSVFMFLSDLVFVKFIQFIMSQAA
jgi:hypothetical protein